LHHIEALAFTTDVSESWLHRWRGLSQLLLAKTAHFCIVLIASLANMVRLSVTLSAEVLAAAIAPDTVIRHVLSGLQGNGVSIVVFLTLDDFSWRHFDDVSACATDHIWIHLNDIHQDIFVNLILLLLIEVHLELEV
jgi:hypothetical protein